MDRLVTVDVKELHLRPKKQAASGGIGNSSLSSRRGSSSAGSAAFTVTNVMYTMSVAVHLSTTNPIALSIQPSPLFILPPLSSATFTLSLTASTTPVAASSPSPPDSLSVRSALLPTGKADSAALLRLFTKPGIHVFKDACLPVYLVGPDAAVALIDGFSLGRRPLDGALRSAELFSRAVSTCSPPELRDLLLRASAAGNAQFVSVLLKAGADANSHNSRRSALSAAVESGSVAAIRALMDSGAAVMVAEKKNQLMHDAAARGRVDIMEALAAGTAGEAWGNLADSAGRTPLHTAAMNGNLEAARFCVWSGRSDPDGADADGWTPLHFAASAGHLDLAEFLLDSSCYSKHALTRDGRATPFDLAVDAGHAHLFDALRLGDALCRAARAGDAEAARSCIARGADAGRRDQNGWTPLHRAAFKGHAEVVEALLEGGAKMDDVDDAGYTPLRLAVEAGHAEVALVLLARGASRAGIKGVKAEETADRFHRLKLNSDAKAKRGYSGRAAASETEVAHTAVRQLL